MLRKTGVVCIILTGLTVFAKPMKHKKKTETYETKTIVVTGTRTKKSIKETPVKTVVVTRRQIQETGARNLVEAVNVVTGVQPEVQCSICNTTGIRVGGVPGRYTLMLIDGLPVFSSLGTIYGLLNISATDVKQLEIVKGSGSVLYGTDAIGGVINVITNTPTTRPHAYMRAEASGPPMGYMVAGYGSMKRGFVGNSISVTHEVGPKIDRDHNHITEMAGFVRDTIADRVVFQTGEFSHLQFRLAGIQEKRQGGGLGTFIEVLNDNRLRRLVTESILSRRLETSGAFEWEAPDGSYSFAVRGAYTYHNQDSDYEGEVYNARQHMGYVEVVGTWRSWERYEIVGGSSLRLEFLDENLALENYRYVMPGVFVQGDWTITRSLEFVHGIRYDWHNTFGSVVTPRGNVKWAPTSWLTIRATVGTGFRAPTTFYEYAHGVRPQGYKIIDRTHSPERSVGGTLDFTFEFKRLELNSGLALTRITHAITVHNTLDGNVEVYNVDRPLDILGVETQLVWRPLAGLRLTLGHGYYHYWDRAGALVSAPPSNEIKFDINYSFRPIHLTINLNGRVEAPMDLEAVYGKGYNVRVDRDDIEGWLDTSNADRTRPKQRKSPSYAVVNMKIRKRIIKGFYGYFGVDNLFDYAQVDHESPLYFPVENGVVQPMDVIYIWGPLRGRYFYGGLELNL